METDTVEEFENFGLPVPGEDRPHHVSGGAIIMLFIEIVIQEITSTVTRSQYLFAELIISFADDDRLVPACFIYSGADACRASTYHDSQIRFHILGLFVKLCGTFTIISRVSTARFLQRCDSSHTFDARGAFAVD